MTKKQVKLSELFISDWSELTSVAQMIKLINYSEALMKMEAGSAEYGHLAIQVLILLRKKKTVVAKLTLEQAVDCFNALTFYHRNSTGGFKTPWFFFPIGTFRTSIRTQIKKFERPEIIGGLPMYNRTFDQLVYADSEYSKFCLAHHQYQVAPSAALEKEMSDRVCGLIAVLYRDPEHFTPEESERLAGAIPGALAIYNRALILHTYANVRGFIINRYPNLFPPSEDDEAGANPIPVLTGPMWMDLRYDLAETDAFKGLQTARDARIYDALDYLDKKALEASKTEKK